MCNSLDLHRPMSHESVLLVGGCHGTCCLQFSNDEESRTARRHLVLANCLVLAACLTIANAVEMGRMIEEQRGSVYYG